MLVILLLPWKVERGLSSPLLPGGTRVRPGEGLVVKNLGQQEGSLGEEVRGVW